MLYYRLVFSVANVHRTRLYFLLPQYSISEVWEGIWNQTHLEVLNFCLERLHHVTISHDNARWNRWCQWPVLLRTYRAVNFCNRYNCIDKGPSPVQSPDANFLCQQSTLSRMTDVCIYLLKPVLELGPANDKSDTLTTRGYNGYHFMINMSFYHQLNVVVHLTQINMFVGPS